MLLILALFVTMHSIMN